MVNQERFQIVSAGKTVRAKAPQEVLQQLISTFSIDIDQGKKLFLKGWVIKDQLSSAQVVQYRTQLQQLGLKIEVHPAGKFDNQAILARLKFARQREARKNPSPDVSKPQAEVAAPPPSDNLKPTEPKPTKEPVVRESAPQQETKPAASEAASPKAPSNHKNGTAWKQLRALFEEEAAPQDESVASRIALLPHMLAAAIVPLMFALLLCLCLYQLGMALWSLPAAALAGEFGAGTILSAVLTAMLVLFVGALVVYPFYVARDNCGTGGSEGKTEEGLGNQVLRLLKKDAPGLFLLLDVVEETCGLGVATKQKGPQNLSSAVAGTQVVVTSGSQVKVIKVGQGQFRLSIGLAAVATLQGGDVLGLIGRALSYYRDRWSRVATELSIGTAQRLQNMQDAFEQERTIFGSDERVIAPVRPLHRMFTVCGHALLPVVERLQNIHGRLSGRLGRQLEAQADRTVGHLLGSDGFQGFAERWNYLVHSDLICGEINREAQLIGKKLADVPAAVRWMYSNLSSEDKTGIDAAMGEEPEFWPTDEPAGHQRVAAVEAHDYAPQLQRVDFSLQKLFDDFAELCGRVSRADGDDSCRPVENRLLLESDKESEAAQQVLTEYFNRVIPRDFLHLALPTNNELAELDLQASIDWLRSRLLDLQELEQRRAHLQLSGARIQVGAALVRANLRIDPRSYDLSGTTPSAADESIRDNRVRLEECQQQRHLIHSLFYQRITRTIGTMDAGIRAGAEAAVSRLRAFDALAEPLTVLGRYGDVVCELIERLPNQELPQALLQKYPQIIGEQVRKLNQLVASHGVAMSAPQQQKLSACGEGVIALSVNGRKDELASGLQALELRCKTVCGVVQEAYQLELARLLKLCLEEEKRLKVKPLRLAAISA
ncbi:SPOR domain-containing protein [Microbulbifer agarilyticus]